MVDDQFGRRNLKLNPVAIGKFIFSKFKKEDGTRDIRSIVSSVIRSNGFITGAASITAAGAATLGSVAISDSKIDAANRRVKELEDRPPVTVPVPISDEEIVALINEKLAEFGVYVDLNDAELQRQLDELRNHTHPTPSTSSTSTSTTQPPPTTTTTTAAPTTTTSTTPPTTVVPSSTTTTTTVPPTTTTTRPCLHQNETACGNNDNGDHHGKGKDKNKGLIKSVLDLLF